METKVVVVVVGAVAKATKTGQITKKEKDDDALLRRLNELIAISKLVLLNHPQRDRLMKQQSDLWPKVKAGVSHLLSADEDKEGCRAFICLPPTPGPGNDA